MNRDGSIDEILVDYFLKVNATEISNYEHLRKIQQEYPGAAIVIQKTKEALRELPVTFEKFRFSQFYTRFITDQLHITQDPQILLNCFKYFIKFPLFCRECGGSGIVYYEENMSPHGSGLTWNMQMEDQCPACANRCPLCGTEGDEYYDDDTATCTACNFQYEEPTQTEPPYGPEIWEEFFDLLDYLNLIPSLKKEEQNA
jgi:hypothetical protein